MSGYMYSSLRSLVQTEWNWMAGVVPKSGKKTSYLAYRWSLLPLKKCVFLLSLCRAKNSASDAIEFTFSKLYKTIVYFKTKWSIIGIGARGGGVKPQHAHNYFRPSFPSNFHSWKEGRGGKRKKGEEEEEKEKEKGKGKGKERRKEKEKRSGERRKKKEIKRKT